MIIEYVYIFIFLGAVLFISALLVLASYLLVFQDPDIEKNSPYECGFQPFEDTRNKFNVRYYLIAILFMIFDLEIIYLFPWAISSYNSGIFSVFSIVIFLSLLVIGFIYEWQKGALEWD